MTDITIREGRPEDAALLAEIGATAFYEAYADKSDAGEIAAHIRVTFGVAQQSAELADPAVTFLIAQVGSEVAGYAKLHIGSPPDATNIENAIEISRIYAMPDWIGRGIGAALMTACLARAEQGGYQTVWLGVWDENARAIAFYEKWGFREAGTISFVYAGEQVSDKMMVRSIAKSD